MMTCAPTVLIWLLLFVSPRVRKCPSTLYLPEYINKFHAMIEIFISLNRRYCMFLIKFSEKIHKLFFYLISSSFFQPELYLCTPIKVDYTSDYYIGESSRREFLLNCVWLSSTVSPSQQKVVNIRQDIWKNGYYEIWSSVGCVSQA